MNVVVMRGGIVSLIVSDTRLAALPFGGGVADAEKDRFAAGARIEVIDAAGAVVAVQSPVYAHFGAQAWLAPGDYTVRLRLPGEAPQEQRVTVNAGETVTARFPPR